MSRAYTDWISEGDMPGVEYPPFPQCERCGADLRPPHDALCARCEREREELEVIWASHDDARR